MVFLNKTFSVIATIFFVFSSIFVFAAPAENLTEELDPKTQQKKEIDEFIAHHLLDSHSFIFTQSKQEDGTTKYYGFSLPVIFYDKAGLHFFMSSKFEHGDAVVESKGNYYKLYHSKIYQTDVEGTITYDEKHFPTNETPLDLSITKNVTMMIFTGVFLLLLFAPFARSYKKNGGLATGVGRILEPVILYVRDDIA